MVELTRAINLAKSYKTISENLENNFPFLINLLDDLKTNENFHSRFLIKLLSYKENNNYPILDNFLSSLGKPFSQISINDPIFSAESDRIDGRIRMISTSIIIENKINGAVDQVDQLNRYISIEKSENKNPTIYVLFLTRNGGGPSLGSFSEQNRSNLKNRYKEINYYSNILPWLIELYSRVLPVLSEYRASLLRSSIEQYVDHLKGLFKERDLELTMKKEISTLINNEFAIDNKISLSEKHQLFAQNKDSVYKLFEYLSELELEQTSQIIKGLISSIKLMKINGVAQPELVGEFGDKYSRIEFHPENWQSKYRIAISFDERFARLFYGIFDKTQSSTENIGQELKIIFPGNSPNSIWPLGLWLQNGPLETKFLREVESGVFLKNFSDYINSILTAVKTNEKLKEYFIGVNNESI